MDFFFLLFVNICGCCVVLWYWVVFEGDGVVNGVVLCFCEEQLIFVEFFCVMSVFYFCGKFEYVECFVVEVGVQVIVLGIGFMLLYYCVMWWCWYLLCVMMMQYSDVVFVCSFMCVVERIERFVQCVVFFGLIDLQCYFVVF